MVCKNREPAARLHCEQLMQLFLKNSLCEKRIVRRGNHPILIAQIRCFRLCGKLCPNRHLSPFCKQHIIRWTSSYEATYTFD